MVSPLLLYVSPVRLYLIIKPRRNSTVDRAIGVFFQKRFGRILKINVQQEIGKGRIDIFFLKEAG
jgi:hypothetical protein